MHFENLAPEQIGTIAMPPRTEDTVEPRAGDGRERGSPAPMMARLRSPSPEPSSAREISVKWSRFCFATRNKSYYAKLVRAFQTFKAVGHTMFTLNSEWAVGCYYRLATACHINWVDYNHKQILLQPERPGPLAPNLGGDLRHLWCLKNKTFCSSEGRFDEIDTELRDSSRADNAEIEAAEALIELKCASLYMDAVECNTPRSCYLEIGIHPPYHCWHEGWSDEDDGANGEDDKRWPREEKRGKQDLTQCKERQRQAYSSWELR
ncbi:hypothetical protein Q5P01_010541 [Channa striata]|uniref:Uncharacterized protein n=1 Tax=Channa striata TaxID=64152 RepID=A0AA88SYG3_CHASR|nr:hypothetical protein Q5P01_010541 [Channa striata]